MCYFGERERERVFYDGLFDDGWFMVIEDFCF